MKAAVVSTVFVVRCVGAIGFTIGYLASYPKFAFDATEYLLFTLASVLSYFVVTSLLRGGLTATLPLWVILVLFSLAYYGKFYYLALFPDPSANLATLAQVVGSASDADAMLNTFRLITVAFAGFAATIWIIFRVLLTTWSASTSQPRLERMVLRSAKLCSTVRTLQLIVLVLIVLTTIVMYWFRIAVMGVEAVYLPFRLSGLIFYTRVLTIPALLALVMWVGVRAGHRDWVTWAFLLLFVHGVTDGVLRASKGSLAFSLIMSFLMFRASGLRLPRKFQWILGLGTAVVICSFPILAQYRLLQIQNPHAYLRNVPILFEALPTTSFTESLAAGLGGVVFRVPGADILLALVGSATAPLMGQVWETFASDRGVSGYITVVVFGYPPSAVMGVAPSLLGWFYIVAGRPFVLVGMIGFTALVLIFWRVLFRINLAAPAVAKAVFLFVLVGACSEGVLDGIGLTIVSAIASVLLGESILRTSISGSRPIRQFRIRHRVRSQFLRSGVPLSPPDVLPGSSPAE